MHSTFFISLVSLKKTIHCIQIADLKTAGVKTKRILQNSPWGEVKSSATLLKESGISLCVCPRNVTGN